MYFFIHSYKILKISNIYPNLGGVLVQVDICYGFLKEHEWGARLARPSWPAHSVIACHSWLPGQAGLTLLLWMSRQWYEWLAYIHLHFCKTVAVYADNYIMRTKVTNSNNTKVGYIEKIYTPFCILLKVTDKLSKLKVIFFGKTLKYIQNEASD